MELKIDWFFYYYILTYEYIFKLALVLLMKKLISLAFLEISLI